MKWLQRSKKIVKTLSGRPMVRCRRIAVIFHFRPDCQRWTPGLSGQCRDDTKPLAVLETINRYRSRTNAMFIVFIPGGGGASLWGGSETICVYQCRLSGSSLTRERQPALTAARLKRKLDWGEIRSRNTIPILSYRSGCRKTGAVSCLSHDGARYGWLARQIDW